MNAPAPPSRGPAAYLARLPLDEAERAALLSAEAAGGGEATLAGVHRRLAHAEHHESAIHSGVAPQPDEAVQPASGLPPTPPGLEPAHPDEAAASEKNRAPPPPANGAMAPNPPSPAGHSLARRLTLGYGSTGETARLACAPPLNRSPMAPHAWLSEADADLPPAATGAPSTDAEAAPARPEHPDRGRGGLRRLVLLALTLGQTYVATSLMTAVLPYHGTRPLEIAALVLYAVLFFWISAGFWTAACGFLVQLRGGDRQAISRTAAADFPLGDARTAVIMPICNEDVARVFAGLRATVESVAGRGTLDHFDFYILSDSNKADTRVAELHAWRSLCRDCGWAGRVFYRWRKHRIKRKSGNVADFCRRWGRNYRYMVVLDADSVMTGDCLTRLVQLMEANPAAGIIQTAPCAAGRDTFYARMQQFATRVYGPLFTAGLHFWQLGESHYWGHNAIIRVAPFTRYCALGRLPGRGSLSGEILSHDFVEAALMRRAGWGVWLAYDLDGSYEEMPPNLVDELSRDRRWCHGNLMNARLFLARGLHPAHRAVFVTGVMAYLSSLLWFVFLLLSTALLAQHVLSEPQYFVEPNQLFPLWPQWRPEWAISLFGATATLLFLPKILAVLLRVAKGAGGFGGGPKLAAGMLLELVLSALLAPIRMLFHAQFVAAALLGVRTSWKSPPRDDSETTWADALRRHGGHTLLGVAWAGFVYWLDPSFLWWLAPVVGAIMLSIPISVFTSRVGLGRGLRAAGLFVIPEERQPPPALSTTAAVTAATPALPGFVDAVVDPAVNALVCCAAGRRVHTARQAERSAALAREAAADGPAGLSEARRLALLDDADALSRLHFTVWSSPAAHPGWLAATAAARPPYSLSWPGAQADAETPIPSRQRGAGREHAAPAG